MGSDHVNGPEPLCCKVVVTREFYSHSAAKSKWLRFRSSTGWRPENGMSPPLSSGVYKVTWNPSSIPMPHGQYGYPIFVSNSHTETSDGDWHSDTTVLTAPVLPHYQVRWFLMTPVAEKHTCTIHAIVTCSGLEFLGLMSLRPAVYGSVHHLSSQAMAPMPKYSFCQRSELVIEKERKRKNEPPSLPSTPCIQRQSVSFQIEASHSISKLEKEKKPVTKFCSHHASAS